MIFHFHQYAMIPDLGLLSVLTLHSQGFDRADGGFGRGYNPDWSLTKTKGIFNTIQVDMEKNGGWNSN